MYQSLYIAVDLGAGSGRVFLAGFAPGELLLEEIRRFSYPPARTDGHLRWDLRTIFEEIKTGLKDAGIRARQLGRPIRSIGVDSWGVDYGLVDAGGELLEQPVCYRDERTEGSMEKVFARIPRDEVFKRTGIQFLVFNTLFQLHAQVEAGIPRNATQLLLIPDLINFFLTGGAVTEYTNATTTQLVDARTRTWDRELIARLGLPGELFAEIVPVGSVLGPLKPPLAAALDLKGITVVAPATHDTGSAVAGAPLEDGWAYISSGTWSLVGVERPEVLIDPEVARHNFTNEGGAFGTIRFLKNVMGLWIIESCRREWRNQDLDVQYDRLLSQIETIEDSPALIFPDEPRFLNPPSMVAAVTEQLTAAGWHGPMEPPEITKAILDSLALRYASVVRTIEELTGQSIGGIQIVGGGSRNTYLNQATANATGLTVLAGPIEATVIGNALAQAIAAGRFASLAEGRQHVRANIRPARFEPRPSSKWEAAAQRYETVARASRP